MLRTSFIAMYKKTLVFWAWPACRPPAEQSGPAERAAFMSKVAQQTSFQSLATPPASATGLWSEEPLEKRNLQKGGEKKASKASKGGENAEGG